MCFTSNVGGVDIHCCPDKTCVGQQCIPELMDVCLQGQPINVPEEVRPDLSWVMLFVLLGVKMFYCIMRLCRRKHAVTAKNAQINLTVVLRGIKQIRCLDSSAALLIVVTLNVVYCYAKWFAFAVRDKVKGTLERIQ